MTLLVLLQQDTSSNSNRNTRICVA